MKKLLSIILVICMLASMSIYAFAEDAQPEVDPAPAAEPAPIVAIPAEPAPVQEAAPAEEPAPVEEPDPANQPAPIADVEVSKGTECDTLQEAVTAAGEDGTVSINETAEDIDIGGAVVKESVTIDLNGNDVTINNPTVGSTGTVTIGMQLLKESEQVTINGDGGSITFDGASSEAEQKEGGNPWLKRGVQNYTDLTLDNVTIDGTDLADNYGAASDKAIDFDPEYENTVISNCNGGLVVDNGASILAAKGDNAIAVSAYTNGGYKDGPSVVIEEDAGTIQGTIIFDGDEGCEEKVETAPSLTIEGGIFNNFLLKIGNAVSSFVDNIKIKGGNFDTKNVEGQDADGNAYKFEDFLEETYVVVEQDGRYVVMTQSEADALKKPVIAVVPTPAPEYIPEPAPAPKPAAKPAVEVKPVEVPAVTVTEATQSVKVQGEEVKVTLNESTVKVEMGEIAKTNENKAAPNVEVVIAVAPEAVESKSAETVVAALKELVKEIRVEHVAEDKEESTISASDYKLDVTEDGKISLTLSDKLMSKLGKGIHEFVVTIGGMEIVFTIEIV